MTARHLLAEKRSAMTGSTHTGVTAPGVADEARTVIKRCAVKTKMIARVVIVPLVFIWIQVGMSALVITALAT